MISKILAATDGSETALKASRYAVHLAKQLGASITILGVIDNRSLPSYHTVPPEATAIHITEPVEDFLREAANRDVARVKKLCEKKWRFMSNGHLLGPSCRGNYKRGGTIKIQSYHSGFPWERGRWPLYSLEV